MSGTPLMLRVRLAFADFRVGHIFHSPPMPATYRQELLERGFLEIVTDDKRPEPKKDVRRPKK